MSTDLSAFKSLFLSTARDYLANARSMLALIQQQKQEDPRRVLYIAFHSLKSQSHVMGFSKTAAFCSILENFFKIHIDQNSVLDPKRITSIQNAIGKLEESTQHIEETNIETITDEEIAQLTKELTQI